MLWAQIGLLMFAVLAFMGCGRSLVKDEPGISLLNLALVIFVQLLIYLAGGYDLIIR